MCLKITIVNKNDDTAKSETMAQAITHLCIYVDGSSVNRQKKFPLQTLDLRARPL